MLITPPSWTAGLCGSMDLPGPFHQWMIGCFPPSSRAMGEMYQHREIWGRGSTLQMIKLVERWRLSDRGDCGFSKTVCQVVTLNAAFWNISALDLEQCWWGDTFKQMGALLARNKSFWLLFVCVCVHFFFKCDWILNTRCQSVTSQRHALKL